MPNYYATNHPNPQYRLWTQDLVNRYNRARPRSSISAAPSWKTRPGARPPDNSKRTWGIFPEFTGVDRNKNAVDLTGYQNPGNPSIPYLKAALLGVLKASDINPDANTPILFVRGVVNGATPFFLPAGEYNPDNYGSYHLGNAIGQTITSVFGPPALKGLSRGAKTVKAAVGTSKVGQKVVNTANKVNTAIKSSKPAQAVAKAVDKADTAVKAYNQVVNNAKPAQRLIYDVATGTFKYKVGEEILDLGIDFLANYNNGELVSKLADPIDAWGKRTFGDHYWTGLFNDKANIFVPKFLGRNPYVSYYQQLEHTNPLYLKKVTDPNAIPDDLRLLYDYMGTNHKGIDLRYNIGLAIPKPVLPTKPLDGDPAKLQQYNTQLAQYNRQLSLYNRFIGIQQKYRDKLAKEHLLPNFNPEQWDAIINEAFPSQLETLSPAQKYAYLSMLDRRSNYLSNVLQSLKKLKADIAALPDLAKRSLLIDRYNTDVKQFNYVKSQNMSPTLFISSGAYYLALPIVFDLGETPLTKYNWYYNAFGYPNAIRNLNTITNTSSLALVAYSPLVQASTPVLQHQYQKGMVAGGILDAASNILPMFFLGSRPTAPYQLSTIPNNAKALHRYWKQVPDMAKYTPPPSVGQRVSNYFHKTLPELALKGIPTAGMYLMGLALLNGQLVRDARETYNVANLGREFRELRAQYDLRSAAVSAAWRNLAGANQKYIASAKTAEDKAAYAAAQKAFDDAWTSFLPIKLKFALTLYRYNSARAMVSNILAHNLNKKIAYTPYILSNSILRSQPLSKPALPYFSNPNLYKYGQIRAMIDDYIDDYDNFNLGRYLNKVVLGATPMALDIAQQSIPLKVITDANRRFKNKLITASLFMDTLVRASGFDFYNYDIIRLILALTLNAALNLAFNIETKTGIRRQ